jgi:hypothetical protein
MTAARLDSSMVRRVVTISDDSLQAIPAQERRLHLRAHVYWQSLRSEDAMPDIAEFDWLLLDDRGSQSFLVTTPSAEGGACIERIGYDLVEEAQLTRDHARLAELPPGSLLHRVLAGTTLRQATAEPVLAEGHYVGPGGALKQYRVALLPLAGGSVRGQFIYGTVSWTENRIKLQ